jgi:hypothetical protein
VSPGFLFGERDLQGWVSQLHIAAPPALGAVIKQHALCYRKPLLIRKTKQANTYSFHHPNQSQALLTKQTQRVV